MKQVDYQEIKSQIKNNELNFYNFYNQDIPLDSYYSIKNYIDNPLDNIDQKKQKLHIVFLDIEVYMENKNKQNLTDGTSPITSTTIYSSQEQIYHAYILLHSSNKDIFFNKDIQDYESEFKQFLEKDNYITQQDQIKIYTFTKETELIYNFWSKIKELDPAILTGWNSDNFDFPYIYNRVFNLFKQDKQKTNEFISRFSHVEIKNNKIDIPEYVICDLMHLYKPRSEGGLNYGQTQQSYSLDFVSSNELKLKKIEYKKNSIDLNEFYNTDPAHFLLYNIVDVVLCKNLNDKLQHIELHNNMRRIMKAPFTRSMIGSSGYYYTYITHNILNNDKFLRFGISKERFKKINEETIESLYAPNTKRGRLLTNAIDTSDYQQIIAKYDGAYVKQPKSEIISDGRLIIDLDASSLYPSMMLEGNISFDSYEIRIIPPLAYKFLNNLNKDLKNPINNKENMLNNILDVIEQFIERNKTKFNPIMENISKWYFTFNYLLTKIYQSNENLKDILYPKNDKQQILLNHYLVPLLDIIYTIHPNKKEYNEFMYDYLFNEENLKNYKEVYVIHNVFNPNQYVGIYNVNETIELMKNYAMNITGTGFQKHENYKGSLTSMLEYMFKMRKEYKKKMYEQEPGSELYEFYNSRQKSVKVIMNSGYGVSGLKSFEFSNHWIAQSITTSGRLTIKLALELSNSYFIGNY